MKSIFVLLIAVFTLSACNTMHGVGRDIESAGEAITGSADKTKEKINQ